MAYFDRAKLRKDSVALDDLDKAIIGMRNGYLVYSYDKLVAHFIMKGLSYVEAVSWVDQNIVGLECMGTFIIDRGKENDQL